MQGWRDVVGWENRYEVSSDGVVRSKSILVRCSRGQREAKPTIRATWQDKDGYHRVRLYDGKRIRNFFIHRLVAMSFIENPNDLPMINHKDGIKTNNKASNLEWVTNKENMIHAKESGLFLSHLTEIEIGIIEIFYHKRKMKHAAIARHLGMGCSNVSRILANKTYQHVKRIFN